MGLLPARNIAILPPTERPTCPYRIARILGRDLRVRVEGDRGGQPISGSSSVSMSRRVEELAELLALDFDETQQGVPKLKEGWRWDDQERGVLAACFSLIVIAYDHASDTRIVQFAHFSVKEFLTSDRLATSHKDV